MALAISGCAGDEPEGQPQPSSDAGVSSSSSGSSSGETSSSSSSSSGSSGTTSSSSGGTATEFTRALGSVYAGDFAAITLAADELDAAGVTWAVTAAPPGSVAPAPTGADTTFRADVPGAYTLVATGTSNGVARTGTFTLTAFEAEVFSVRAKAGAVGAAGSFGIRAGGSIVGGSRDIGCPRTSATLTSDENLRLINAELGLAVWYAPPGVPSRVIYTDTQFGSNDGGTDTSLAAATSLSGCIGANAATTIVAQGFHAYGAASFRADGERIAYIDPAATGRPFYSVGFDGSAPFALGKVVNSKGRMAWRPDGKLATLTSNSPAWTIQVFSDQVAIAEPLPTPFMTCDGAVQPALAFLDDNRVLVAYKPTAGESGLRIMHPGADPAHTCVLDKVLADATIGQIYGDFVISPDKTKIAFTAQAGGARSVYIVPVDGSTPPKAINTTLGLATDAGLGATEGESAPNWMGTNSMLAWSSGDRITSVRIDGTELSAGATSHTVDTSPDADTGLRTTAGRADCSVALVGAGSGSAVFLGALGLLVARRRRRNV